MTTELDTLSTALYVHIDDRLKTPRWRGRPPRLTDAELVTLAVAQAMLGFHCEARWLRLAHAHRHGLFPHLPQRPACNKRLRAALGLVKRAIRSLATDCDLWLDDVWIVDSTPVECARSRETVKRSDLAGWANYGYCRSHSRFYWGLKLHLVCTPAGLPVTWALADPKIDERQVLAALIDNEPHLAADRPGLLILADKGYIAAELDRFLAARSITLLRPSYRNRGTPRPGARGGPAGLTVRPQQAQPVLGAQIAKEFMMFVHSGGNPATPGNWPPHVTHIRRTHHALNWCRWCRRHQATAHRWHYRRRTRRHELQPRDGTSVEFTHEHAHDQSRFHGWTGQQMTDGRCGTPRDESRNDRQPNGNTEATAPRRREWVATWS